MRHGVQFSECRDQLKFPDKLETPFFNRLSAETPDILLVLRDHFEYSIETMRVSDDLIEAAQECPSS